MAKLTQEQIDNMTEEEIDALLYETSIGDKFKEGAYAGSGLDEIKRVGSAFKKGQSPEELGQSIKAVAKLPLNVVTSVPGAVVGGVMGATGLNDLIGKGMSKLSPENQKRASTLLEIAGVLGGKVKVPKITKGMSVIDVAKASIRPDGSKVMVKPRLSKAEAKTARNIIETGKVTGEDIAGSDIIAKGGQQVIKTGKKQFVPAKLAVEGVKVTKNIGKNTFLKISKDLKKQAKEIDIDPENVSKILKSVEMVKNAKSLKDMIKTKQLMDKKFRGMYAENPTLSNDGLKVARRFINNEIKNNIKDPIVKKNWIDANESWQSITDGMELLRRAEKGAEMKVFKGIFNKGAKAIEDAKRISGEDTVKVAGIADLFGRSSDKGTGVFIPNKYARAITDIGEIRGKAIFGNDWNALKNLQTIVRQLESPDSIVKSFAKEAQGIKGLVKYMGGKEFERIIKGKTASKFFPLKLENAKKAGLKTLEVSGIKGALESAIGEDE